MSAQWVGTCPTTGKRMYSTRVAAKTAKREIGDTSLSVYRCERCGYLHLGHNFGLSRQWHRNVRAEVAR